MATNDRDSNNNSGRGFAGMDPDRQREIASEGGKAAHESGHAHEFDSEEARKAGQKGGKASHGSDSSRSSRDNNSGSNANRDRDSQGRFE
jgi:general stress protein YciG